MSNGQRAAHCAALILFAACAYFTLSTQCVLAQDASLQVTPVAPGMNPPQVVRDTSTIITELIAGFLGGALFGGGGVLAIITALIRYLSQNDALKVAIERLYLSAPPQTQALLREGAVAINMLGDLADEVTDGKIDPPKLEKEC